MSRRYKNDNHEEINVWSAFTDLMSNAFIILSLLLLIAMIRPLILSFSNEDRSLSAKGFEKNLNNLKTDLKRKNVQIEKLKEQVEELQQAPPVFLIENSGELQFESGSAKLSPMLREYVSGELVNKIEYVARKRGVYVVEVIGHTDGQISSNKLSNLDELLEKAALGRISSSDLRAGSNVDLGLMRALEIVRQLQYIQRYNGRLKGLQFRAYSAAQLIMLDGNFAKPNRVPDASRRRIEIRFSPLGSAQIVRTHQ